MKPLFALFISIIITSSCVSTSKYKELERITNDQLKRMNELVIEKEQECAALKEKNEELEEKVDELSDKIFLMGNAMEEAYHSYHFWGPNDTFTRIAIDDLYRYF